jgi:DNA polymerase IIIc chi subunit
MEHILQSYLRRLTNLSGNNRSLLLLKLLADQFLDLHELDFADNEPSFSKISGLIGKGGEVKLCDEIDPRDSSVNKNSTRLRKIARMDAFIFEERGARDLYVGWPFVSGKLSDGTLINCPLIFFPATITRKTGAWYLQLRKEVNITFNKSFLLAYAHFNKVSVSEELLELSLNDLDFDITKFRTQLYQLLKKSNVEINFNRDLFMDQLVMFRQSKKEQFDKEHKEGELKLYSEAVLGIFPQSGSHLVPDYMSLLEQESIEDLSSFFESRVFDTQKSLEKLRFSDQVKEETTFTPFAIDASQEKALNMVKSGSSIVIQGPPGTGKSQLICNLIADFIARGKNVLLVCQKKAALDVVFERLSQTQLNDFVGLVHDFKNDRKDIFEQIQRQIDNVDDNKKLNYGLDAIHLEREYQQTSRVIDQITEKLDEFKFALFDIKECGKSIKELYLSSDPDAPAIPLNQQYRELHYSRAIAFKSELGRYLDYHQKFTQKPSFWASGPSFALFGVQDLIRLKELINEVPAFEDELKNATRSFAEIPLDFESALHFIGNLVSIDQLRTNLDNDIVFSYFQKMMDESTDEDPLMLSNMERNTMQCFKGDGLESSLPSDALGRFQESLERAIRARKNPFSWLRWKLFSADKIFITRVIVANDLKSDSIGFEILLNRIDNRLNYEHIVTRIERTPWLTGLPKNFRKIDLQNWFFYQKLALKCVNLHDEVRTLGQFISYKGVKRQTFVGRLESLSNTLGTIPTQLQLWARYINEGQIRAILLGQEKIEDLRKQLTNDFDAVVAYHKLRENFSEEETRLISKLTENGESDKAAILKLLDNSLTLAWIDHIETKYPILRSVSSYEFDQLTTELRDAIATKQTLSQDILLLKSRERTYKDLDYNRLNNRVTYKELYHQVTKKRKIWPIRKVISQYHEELFSLLPCWLTSPESASAIFPMEQNFDLVIFDEASQCFAERGIPAMYRGAQVVIVGDDKQLQPNDLYQVRWEEEETEAPELEVSSLLALGKHYLPEISLRGHYRSNSLELIEFSNKHFYNGKLKLLPSFNVINANTPAINYLHVNGVWEQNTNMIEAESVIELIKKLNTTSPNLSIGVVTFNASQQSLIMDLLEQAADKNDFQSPKSLIVKNIENVQGDERDIIIFCTAYAPDKNGKLQLRFGSLNQAGGENRLNVAITRAKTSIYIVTSILPHQLNTENTAQAGPKLLKAYLEFGKNVSDGKWLPDSQEDNSQTPSWYLRQQLEGTEDGFEIKKTLPFSDLTIRSGQKSKGLILTDDELYFDTLSAKDAHCYRQNHFSEKRWPYMQVFSREQWLNPSQTKEKINKFIHRLGD